MRSIPFRTGLAPALFLLLLAFPAFADSHVLFWAPGYPGDTEQAQETMDRFAATLSNALGEGEGEISVVYHSDPAGGLAEWEAGAVDIAMVSAPVYFEYGERFALTPVMQAVRIEPTTGRWTLVAGIDKVDGPDALSGWTVGSHAGFSPPFVRQVLAEFGELPGDTTITFQTRVRSTLRRAAKGEPVAVLLDGTQAAALDSLSFVDQLEVVYRSEPMPSNVVCFVGDRFDDDRRERWQKALRSLADTVDGRSILEEMRLKGFEPLGADRLMIAR
jgi:ABC-type phosphate/phosphonate transport system substrate-binding protein